MPLTELYSDDCRPLLQRSSHSDDSGSSYKTLGSSRSLEAAQPGHHKDDSVEQDAHPETAVLGRNLGWSSAYILIISRVIGSGIFATPGAIVRSVGSVGITLLLWIAGAAISWFGLMVTLEYGCMLPRSGGRRSLRCSLTLES